MYEIELEITQLLRSELFSVMPYLALPLGMLETGFSDDIEKTGTDGRTILFAPKWLKTRFINAGSEPLVHMLHQLYHCLLLHPFSKYTFHTDLEHCDLACDIIVWNLIHETFSARLPPELAEICREARRLCGALADTPTVPALSRLLTTGASARDKTIFRLDDHSMWPSASLKAEQHKLRKSSGPGAGGAGDESMEERWRNIAQKTRARIPPPDKKAGRGTKSLRKSVMLGDLRRCRYADFLKRFSVFREDLRPNADEFQYSYYLYGLEHYQNVPIIEPLEYTEARRLFDLAVVIDTSGSCSRELTQMFLEETRDILLTENLFFRRFNLHIIQCDSIVQRDDKITGPDEFQAYIDKLEIVGQGGTDYRPAFEYIDRLVQTGELSQLKGILYFTDGYGLYPRNMPVYETAFVFIEHRYDDIDVPDWALKLVLDAEMPKGRKEYGYQ